MPKTWFWDPLQNPAGCKMAPKITQVAPKGFQKTSDALTFWGPWKRLAPQKPPKRHRGSFWMTSCWFLNSFGLSFHISGNKLDIVFDIPAKPSSTKLNARCPQRTGKELRKTCKNERSRRNLFRRSATHTGNFPARASQQAVREKSNKPMFRKTRT